MSVLVAVQSDTIKTRHTDMSTQIFYKKLCPKIICALLFTKFQLKTKLSKSAEKYSNHAEVYNIPQNKIVTVQKPKNKCYLT